MTHIRKKGQSILSFLLVLMGMTLYGQNDIYLSYECSDQIIRPTKAKIKLMSPDKKTFYLFEDSVRNFNFSKRNYFKSKGKYTLSICFEAEKYGKDSLNYVFELNGDEIITTITLSFDYREKRFTIM
jgi:hypothetical protein